jgi:RNA polymerase subunit RPABC4/transcription elongation factor Spt4
MDGQLVTDAADAIEALQAEVDALKRVDYKRCQECLYLGQPVDEQQMPKRGEWELIDGVEPMRWGCSQCKYLSWETSNYCPRCGAKMEVQK